MAMGVRVRRATAEDAPGLARVHVAAWREAYRGIVPDSHFERFTVEARTERFRQSLAEGSEETYVAEAGGEIAGLLTLGGCRDADLDEGTMGEIWGIYLAPEHWRQGIGTTLCREGEGLLAARGYSAAVLWVLEANEQARRFYEALGFQADGAKKEVHLVAPLTAVRYRKEL